MFVTSDVHVHWLRRFITARTPQQLSLTQCDKMQSAVKRKARGGGGRQERRGGYYLIYVSGCVCMCVCVSLSRLSSAGDNTFWRNCLEALSPRQDTWLIFSFEPLRYIYL